MRDRLRVGRVGRNALYNLGGWIVFLAANLVVLPYAVRHLGTEEYGVFLLITSVVGFLGLLELGLGDAVIKYVAEYATGGDWAMARRTVNTAVGLLLLIGAVAGAVIVVLSVPLAGVLLQDTVGLTDATVLSLRIAGLGVAATLAISPLGAVPQALQRYDIHNAVIAGAAALNAILTVALIAAGYGLVALVVMTVATTVLTGLVQYGVARRMLRGFRLSLQLHLRTSRTLLAYGGYILVGKVAYLTNTQVFRVLVGLVLGASAVTYFTVSQKAVLAVAGVFASLANVMLPAASELQARRDVDGMLRMLRRSELVIGGLSAAPFAVLALLASPVLSVWMGAPFAAEAARLFAIMAGAQFLYVLAMPPNRIALGIGHARAATGVAVASTIALCVSVGPLVAAFGLEGVGVSVLLGGAVGLSMRFVLIGAIRRDYGHTG